MWLRALLFVAIFIPSASVRAFSPDAHRSSMVNVFRSLGDSDAAVDALVRANGSVDSSREFKNPPSHFDYERLVEGSALLRKRLKTAVLKLVAGDVNGARMDLGKAT